MKHITPTLARRLLVAASLWVFFLCALQGVARADPFYMTVRGEISPNQVPSYLGLSTYPTGTRAVNVPPGGTVEFPNLLRVQLDATPANYTGVLFNLHLYIYYPADEIMLDNTVSLVGTVTNQGVGGVVIDFNNTPYVFGVASWQGANGPAFRIYSLTVDDLFVLAGSQALVTGRVTDVTTPEPATLLLLGTGLAATGAAIRRRRSRAKSAGTKPRA